MGWQRRQFDKTKGKYRPKNKVKDTNDKRIKPDFRGGNDERRKAG